MTVSKEHFVGHLIGPNGKPQNVEFIAKARPNITKSEASAGIGWVDSRYPEGNAKRYGATGDGVTDDTAALQVAFTLATNYGVKIHIPSGTYVITSTLLVQRLTGSKYATGYIHGDGQGYSGEPMTYIDATAVLTDPAICVTAPRNVTIEDLTIIGPNLAPGLLTTADIYYDSAWVTSGVRDSRYSPQCAIGMDCNTGSNTAGGGYPNLTYTGNTQGGLGLTLNRINFYNNVVGVMLNPTDTTLNGDLIKIDDCHFINNKVCIAAGQAQTKGTNITNCGFQRCRTTYDGLEYGQQQGRGPLFMGCQWVQTFELVSWSAAFGPASFVNCYAESLQRIGFAGNAISISSGISFHGTDLILNTDGAELSPYCFEGKNTLFNFYGGRFGSGYTQTVNNAAYNIISKNAVFDGCEMTFNDRFRPFIQGAAGLVYPVELRNVRASDDTGSAAIVYNRTAAHGPTLTGRVSAHHTNPRITITPYASTSIDYDYVRTTDGGEVRAPGTSSNFAFTDPSFSFDNTDAAASFLVGDILYWKMDAQGAGGTSYTVPALKVTAVAAPTITCSYLYRRADYDETYSPTSSMYIAVHHWAPGEVLTGDTATSTTLSNVSPTTILQNGDWISGTADFAANTRVVSGGGTATITLSRATTGTTTGQTLFWDRLHTPTTTAAF